MATTTDVGGLTAAKRILVLGPSGSGKTYVALRLGDMLGVPLVHLDARFWRPGWVSTPQDEWRRTVASMVARERWIMDGTYESTLDLRVPAADAIVVVARSRVACLWGVVRRAVTHRGGPRPDAPPRQPIDLAFLRYIWRYPARTAPVVDRAIREHGDGTPVFFLGRRRDVRRFLGAVREHCMTRGTMPERAAR